MIIPLSEPAEIKSDRLAVKRIGVSPTMETFISSSGSLTTAGWALVVASAVFALFGIYSLIARR